MNDSISLSRKRKRGKKKNVIIEDDDDAIDIVTFKEVTTDTRGGPVKKRVEVPIRPVAGSQAGPSSQPLLATASQSEDFGVSMSDMFDDVPMREPSKNKVVEIHICVAMMH
jgi:hypothetical protein